MLLPHALIAEKSSASAPQISGTVIVASMKGEDGVTTAPELLEFQQQLQDIFGYDTFRVAGVKKEPLSSEGQELEIKTKNFSMHLEYKGSYRAPNDGVLMREFNVKLYQRDELIVQGEVEAPNGQPFYVKGPVWGSKQIILMILLR